MGTGNACNLCSYRRAATTHGDPEGPGRLPLGPMAKMNGMSGWTGYMPVSGTVGRHGDDFARRATQVQRDDLVRGHAHRQPQGAPGPIPATVDNFARGPWPRFAWQGELKHVMVLAQSAKEEKEPGLVSAPAGWHRAVRKRSSPFPSFPVFLARARNARLPRSQLSGHYAASGQPLPAYPCARCPAGSMRK